jgi:hypothetical protein
MSQKNDEWQTKVVRLQYINLTDISEVQKVKTDWDDLLDKHKNEENLDDLYRSSDWIEHLVKQKQSKNVYIAVIRVDKNKIIGIIPFTRSNYQLKFDVKSYTLFAKERHVAWILGSALILPQTINIYDHFFKSLMEEFPDLQGIYFETLKENSFLFDYLKKSANFTDNYFLYLPEGLRNYYYLVLPQTFESYLQALRSKKRKNIERRISTIKEHVGMVRLQSFHTADSVRPFMAAAMQVVRNSWQYQVIGQRLNDSEKSIENKMDLAKRGIFHGYVLFGGDKPLAFSLGFNYQSIYTGEETAYQKDFAAYSPGIVLIYLMIEDLIRQGIGRLNMGVGEGSHKHSFANRQTRDAAVLLVRKNPGNRVLIALHQSFMMLRNFLRKAVEKNQN